MRIDELSALFKSLNTRIVEITQVNPGKTIHFGM